MNGNLPKTTEQLVQMVNSSNERNNPHFDYYKKKYLNLVMMKYPLIRCLLLLILKEFNLCQKNKSMFRFIVKCNNYKLNQSDNTSNNAIIGPVNTNSPFDPSYIYTLCQFLCLIISVKIIMSRIILYIYRISNKENGAIAKFIEGIRLVDNLNSNVNT